MILSNRFNHSAFATFPVIGIVRGLDYEVLNPILPIYMDSGFSCIEITMNTKNATKQISELVKNYGHQLNIGAGTVCSEDDLSAALNAGANFIVTPMLEKKVIKTCVNNKIPVFPGAFTPTEIFEAWSLGATMVKVFPASSLGPEFIKAIKAPFPHIKLMPTGGIGANDLLNYKLNGADGFGIGSPLFPINLLEQGNLDELAIHFKKFKKAFEA